VGDWLATWSLSDFLGALFIASGVMLALWEQVSSWFQARKYRASRGSKGYVNGEPWKLFVGALVLVGMGLGFVFWSLPGFDGSICLDQSFRTMDFCRETTP
jgi:hypothetical protein